MVEFILLLLYRKNPYIENCDMVKVNEYMDLDSLAKVLDELVKEFSGILLMYNILISMYMILIFQEIFYTNTLVL